VRQSQPIADIDVVGFFTSRFSIAQYRLSARGRLSAKQL
jgi:hypothetical protein